MQWLIERFNEPSTHGGFAALTLVVKGFFPQYAIVADAVAALFAALAVVKSEPAK